MSNQFTPKENLAGKKSVVFEASIDTYAAGGVTIGVSQTGYREIEHIAVLNVTGRNCQAAYIGGKIVLSGSTPQQAVYPYVAASASANDVAGTTDYASFHANVAVVSSLAAGAATALTIAAQPKHPRNICIAQKNVSGANPANTTARTYTVVGTFNGKPQTDIISIPGNVSLATNKGVLVNGTKPFDTVTSITPSGAATTGLQHAAGVGTILGLPTPLLNGVYTDVKIITRLGNAIAPATGSVPGAGKINASLDGVDVGDITANDDIIVKYLGVGAAEELPAGTLSPAAVVTVLVVGY